MDPLASGSNAGDGDGDGDDGGDDGGGGRIFPGHPGPIPNAPRDNISRKGIPSLRLAYQYAWKSGGVSNQKLL